MLDSCIITVLSSIIIYNSLALRLYSLIHNLLYSLRLALFLVLSRSNPLILLSFNALASILAFFKGLFRAADLMPPSQAKTISHARLRRGRVIHQQHL
jgi:hypothetical protein